MEVRKGARRRRERVAGLPIEILFTPLLEGKPPYRSVRLLQCDALPSRD